MTALSDSYLDNIIQSMNDMLIVLRPDHRIERINQAVSNLLGYSENELLALHVEALVETPRMASLLNDASRTRRSLETVIRTKQGQEIPVSISMSPMTDSEGNLTGIVCVAQDITERKQAEEVLKNNLEKLTILQRVDSELNHKLHVPYVLEMALDAAMRYSGANAGAIELVENNEIYSGKAIGPYPSEWMYAYPRPIKGIAARVLSTKQAERITDVTADSDYVAVIASTRALICIPLMSQDRIVGLLSLETPRPHYFTEEAFEFLKILTSRIAVAIDNAHLYDISQTQLAELQTLYERVSSLEQIKTDMIRIAAHDLRNPLAVINGFVSLLHETSLDTKQKEFVKLIDSSTQRMRKIVDDILSLQRIEAMGNAVSQNEVQLATLVEQVYQEHLAEAQVKQQDFRLTLPKERFLVLGDTPQLKEAINNLVSNAIKYTPDHKRIDIRLHGDETHLALEVEDEGFGIPEALQKDLFRPFFRAKIRETRDIDGTGLGLHLVKNIIERHNGEMIFRSVYGQGSVFGFRLPAKPVTDLFGDDEPAETT